MNYRTCAGGLLTAIAFSALVASPVDAAQKAVSEGGTILTAGNDSLQVHIQARPGSGVGLFTVTSASGSVLYGNGRPGTSYTTIHSYTSGADYVQGKGKSGISLDAYGSVQPIDGTGFRVTYQLPGGAATPDKLTIVQDILVTADSAADSQVDVTTYVEDTGDTPEKIGVRYLWDYDVDGDDGPVLTMGPSTKVTAETLLSSTGATVTSAGGVTASSSAVLSPALGGGPTLPQPDSIRYVLWQTAFDKPFEYAVNSSTIAGGKDSAVLTYFGSSNSSALVLAPGQGTVVTASLSANADDDKVTVTVTPKIAVIGEEITVTAKESGKPDGDKVHWKAPGGDPKEGVGWTFKTKYKSVGKKTIAISGLEDDDAPKSVTVNVIKVLFDIDGQTKPNKSLVFVKNTVGVIEDGAPVKPLRLRTPCHVWVEGTPDADVKVVLKNPDTKLLMTKQLTATTKLTLPANGDKVNFLLYGETQSAAIGDAKVEAHLDDKSDKLLGDQKVTVFYFDPKLVLSPDGHYATLKKEYQPQAGHGTIKLSSSARAKPDTVDINAGVLADIDIGIAQNTLSIKRSYLEDKPLVRWGPGIKAGTKANVPSKLSREKVLATASNDTSPTNDPLFSNRLARPNAASAQAYAFVSQLSSQFNVSVKDPDTNEIVGTAIYSLNSISFDDHWRTWCVAYKKDSKAEFPVSEGTWDLKFSTKDAAADQVAKAGAVAAAANAPIRGTPFTRDTAKTTIVKGANVVVVQPGVESVTLTPASLKGGTPGKATIKLTQPAGFGGTPVNLGSNRPAIAKTKVAIVVVPAGAKTVDVDIDTVAVGAEEHVRISASCHEEVASARLTVTK